MDGKLENQPRWVSYFTQTPPLHLFFSSAFFERAWQPLWIMPCVIDARN